MKRLAPFLAVALTVGLAPRPGGADGPLDGARDAMRTASFTGKVRISWVDDAGSHQTTVTIKASGGVVEVDGPTPVVAGTAGRLVHTGDGWSLLWPGQLLPARVPSVGHKYTVRPAPDGDVAGRPVETLELVSNRVVRERLALDKATRLVLRREQLDDAGRPVRSMAFTTIELSPPQMHQAPGATRTDVPRRLTSVPAPYRAPSRLDGGYQRVGVYRRGEVLHAVYGDGVYGLSVFEQPGRLDWNKLPSSGRWTSLAGHRARTYVWPGGQVVTWQAGGSAYTVVGDGPAAEVLAAAASLREARSLSTGQRMRQAARELVETISARP
ncbi:MAG: hypothetical protein QOJ09_2941 [Actinomycetota bacterium]|nr:hypothetical protein [Actinomycetota bacterium]